jgi:excinuclease UvrABC ATPase subunit
MKVSLLTCAGNSFVHVKVILSTMCWSFCQQCAGLSLNNMKSISPMCKSDSQHCTRQSVNKLQDNSQHWRSVSQQCASHLLDNIKINLSTAWRIVFQKCTVQFLNHMNASLNNVHVSLSPKWRVSLSATWRSVSQCEGQSLINRLASLYKVFKYWFLKHIKYSQ